MNNSYLNAKIGQIHRDECIAEAAAQHRLAERRSANPATPVTRGFWSSVRDILSTSADDGMLFLPRLGDDPTRH